MKLITLNKEHLDWCDKISKERYLRHKGNPYAKYENTPSGHLVGLLGELGAYLMLKQEGVYNAKGHFHADDSLPDITVGTKKIEVKTWKEENWISFGRCIQENQYAKVQTLDYIVWATIKDNTVCIQGYSYPSDFETQEPRMMGKGVLNRQISRAWDIGIMLAFLR